MFELHYQDLIAHGVLQYDGHNYTPVDYSPALLQKHKLGEIILGGWPVSNDGFCTWLAIDVDNHNKDSKQAEENLCDVMRFLGTLPHTMMLEKSNPYGGFHLWIFPPSPIPVHDAITYLRSITSTHEIRPARPLTINDKPLFLSNNLRLPGKRPRDDYWSEIYVDGGWKDIRDLM